MHHEERELLIQTFSKFIEGTEALVTVFDKLQTTASPVDYPRYKEAQGKAQEIQKNLKTMQQKLLS